MNTLGLWSSEQNTVSIHSKDVHTRDPAEDVVVAEEYCCSSMTCLAVSAVFVVDEHRSWEERTRVQRALLETRTTRVIDRLRQNDRVAGQGRKGSPGRPSYSIERPLILSHTFILVPAFIRRCVDSV
jgi:hypothetical protein